MSGTVYGVPTTRRTIGSTSLVLGHYILHTLRPAPIPISSGSGHGYVGEKGKATPRHGLN